MKTFLCVAIVIALLFIVLAFILKKYKYSEEIYTNACLGDEDDKEEIEQIKQKCDIEEEKEPVKNNIYFFNIHECITKSGKHFYCVVCNAVIKCHNYRIVLPNSYYPYINSYTEKNIKRIKAPFTPNLTAEEFLSCGSVNFTNVGTTIKPLED